MDTVEKLRLLSNDSRYDLACACGTQKDEHRRRGLDGRWLYPVALPQGGYTVLLKTLLSNACANDCRYCPLRADVDSPRCTLRPEEVAGVFMEYLRRKWVSGLFLSSSVIGSADYTMERINAAARILRRKHGFRGYIHLKIIPGASDAAVEEALSLGTAVSLNIETPSKKSFGLLSSRKDYENDILRPMSLMGRLTGRGMKYSKVKCTTQFIVGASDETDTDIVDSMYGLYGRMNFKRVYYSAYQKGLGRPDIPGERQFFTPAEATFQREHRLYQVDFLCRKYGFGREDISFDEAGNLSLDRDPKEVWAERHPEFYPVRLNSSSREALLRVPGLGPETVKRIIRARRERNITRLVDVGLKGKRAERARRYVIFE
jgi:predicted DNA-binding helix-hairpin-helix protein